ncbi:DUF983 domain-containing protein [Aurantibacillus circumpalustris]|uniref:DUF983 domain-containing protein n=1 Tax=Aurantibacillus circumpalustris TaxID=3036359 RepID=UPI00295B5A9B|nr:DUF983 domain-containing protein [Aurantibacillus circumpalustris]
MLLLNILYSTIFNKCPRCHKGDVFTAKNPYALNKIFSMHEHCSHCELKYQKEPSFFYGAMYVSYALTSGWFIIWYVLYITTFPDIDTMTFALAITGSIVVFSPITLRYSRLIWMNFFFKYSKEYSITNTEKKQIQL